MAYITDISHPLDALLQRRKHDLWRLCMRHAWGNADRANDLMQEAVLALMHKVNRMRANVSESEERRWVLRVVDNALIDMKRKRRVEYTVWGKHAPELPDTSNREARELIDEIGSSLSNDDQRFLRLYLDGYGINEIATILDISPNAASTRMHRLVKRMRNIYNETYKIQ